MMTDSDSDSGNEAWSYDNGLSTTDLPSTLWEVLEHLGYEEPPAYRGRPIDESGARVFEVHIQVEEHPQHKEWEFGQWRTVSCNFRDGKAKLAYHVLALFCEQHKERLAGTNFEMLPINNSDSPDWQRRVRRIARTDAGHHSTALYAQHLFDLHRYTDSLAAIHRVRASEIWQERTELRAQLHASEQRVEEVTAALTARTEELEERTAVLAQRNNYIHHLETALGAVQDTMADMGGEIQGLEQQVEQLQQQLQAALAPPEEDPEEEGVSDVDYEDPPVGPAADAAASP